MKPSAEGTSRFPRAPSPGPRSRTGGFAAGQIVKSLVFLSGEEPVIVLCAGDRADAGTGHAVFEVRTEALVGAIPSAELVAV